MQHLGRLGDDPLEDAAVDPGHRQHAGRAAAVEQLEQSPARGRTTRAARRASKRISVAAAASRSGERARSRRSAEAGAQVLGGEVHAAALGVLAHVAQDVRQLHRHAEVVGESSARAVAAVAAAEDRQAQAADRCRRPGGSRRPARRTSRTRCRARPSRRRRSGRSSASTGRSKRRRRRPARPITGSWRSPAPQRRSSQAPLARRGAASLSRGERVAVADVVDAAGERVHGAHRLALVARQQPDAVVEVRRRAAGDLLAVGGSAATVAPWRSSCRRMRAPHGERPLSASARSVARRSAGRGLEAPARARRSARRRSRRARRGRRRRTPATANRGRPRSVRTSGAPRRSSSSVARDLEGEQRAQRSRRRGRASAASVAGRSADGPRAGM